MTGAEALLPGVLIGIGGTVVLDLWALFLARVLRVPGTNWPMVGRWIGNMPRGRFVHENMASAPPVKGEAAIGWGAHYAIGASYGLLLLVVAGPAWLARPTVWPPLLLAWALLVAPYFLMMPGMGAGIAGAKTPKPGVTRLKSLIGHSVFGLGMYATALALAAIPTSCPPGAIDAWAQAMTGGRTSTVVPGFAICAIRT